jgi:hypothetical protein
MTRSCCYHRKKPDTMMRCPCGITFDSHDPAGSYAHRQHIYAKHGAKKLARWSMAGDRELIALSKNAHAGSPRGSLQAPAQADPREGEETGVVDQKAKNEMNNSE